MILSVADALELWRPPCVDQPQRFMASIDGAGDIAELHALFYFAAPDRPLSTMFTRRRRAAPPATRHGLAMFSRAFEGRVVIARCAGRLRRNDFSRRSASTARRELGTAVGAPVTAMPALSGDC